MKKHEMVGILNDVIDDRFMERLREEAHFALNCYLENKEIYGINHSTLTQIANMAIKKHIDIRVKSASRYCRIPMKAISPNKEIFNAKT